jgi:hypothetical protein
VADFLSFTNLKDSVARSHIIAWRKLSALFSLFDYFCERTAVIGDPAGGVKRPATNNDEGSTPALSSMWAQSKLSAKDHAESE